MKKLDKKGFTLAELLIVVAIIAVLVAIAIPVFSTQLEKSRESTEIANIRDYYAEIAVALIDGTLDANNTTCKVSGGLEATYVPPASGATTFTVSVAGVKIQQTVFDAWTISDPSVAGVEVTAPTADTDTTVTYTFTIQVANNGAESTYLSGIAYGAAT